jgi:hypothetical protein
MTHCDELPDEYPGKAMAQIAELHESMVAVTRDADSWTTVYECRLCGQVWEELFEELGHGEVPVVRKLKVVR